MDHPHGDKKLHSRYTNPTYVLLALAQRACAYGRFGRQVFKQREVDRRAVREERKQEKAIRDRKEVLYID